MKDPIEMAKMIAWRIEEERPVIGHFGIVREAEIVANECSETLAEIYVNETRHFVRTLAKIDLKMIIPPRLFDDENEPMASALDLLCEFPKVSQRKRDGLAEIIESWYTFARTLRATMERKHRDRKFAADPNPLNLPQSMNTERARKYIQKAIDAEYIKEQSAGRYKWQRNNKQMYAYFIYKIYSLKYMPQRPPVEEMEAVFCIKHLAQHASKANDPRNVKEWKKTIDEFFED